VWINKYLKGFVSKWSRDARALLLAEVLSLGWCVGG